MPTIDKRNVLHVGPPKHSGETGITPAMVESVRQRINDAGGTLTVWAVLHEDVYESKFDVLMMKSAQDSVRTYDAGSLYRPRNRRIFMQGSMRSDHLTVRRRPKPHPNSGRTLAAQDPSNTAKGLNRLKNMSNYLAQN